MEQNFQKFPKFLMVLVYILKIEKSIWAKVPEVPKNPKVPGLYFENKKINSRNLRNFGNFMKFCSNWFFYCQNWKINLSILEIKKQFDKKFLKFSKFLRFPELILTIKKSIWATVPEFPKVPKGRGQSMLNPIFPLTIFDKVVVLCGQININLT